MCIHCAFKVLRRAEDFIQKYERGQLKEFEESEWFRGIVDGYKAIAKDLRAALENRPREEDADETVIH
jgi:hypothetical protein